MYRSILARSHPTGIETAFRLLTSWQRFTGMWPQAAAVLASNPAISTSSRGTFHASAASLPAKSLGRQVFSPFDTVQV
jgi:hypothetical protein